MIGKKQDSGLTLHLATTNRPAHDYSAFSRRQVLQGGAALAGSSLLTGLLPCAFARQTSPKMQPRPDGALTDASLTVAATSTGAIGSAFAGFSLEKGALSSRLVSPSNSAAVGLYKRLGHNILRIGGDTVDKSIWTPNGPGKIKGQVAPSDIDALASFCKITGWKCLYGVNLGGASSGATTPALAAAEVAYAARQFGTSLYGIEIGNEPDSFGQTNHAFANKDWSLEKYISLWNDFRSAIVAAVPGVVITGPAAAKHVSTWTIPFGQAVTKDKIALLTQHYYRANRKAPTATIPNLISPDPYLISELAELKAGADNIGVPFRMAEVNSYAGGGAPGVSNTYASALWVVDFLFNCAQGGATGADFHGGGEGPRYQAIADSNGVITEVRPEYYGILLFNLAGQGSLCATQLSAGSLNVTAYAIQTSTGLNIVLVNKEAVQNLHLTAQLPHIANFATLIEMTQLSGSAAAPNLAATSGVTIQGSAVALDGRFSPKPAFRLDLKGSQLTCYVPALSAVVIRTT